LRAYHARFKRHALPIQALSKKYIRCHLSSMLIAEFYNPIPPAIDAAIQFRIKSVQRFHFSLSSMQRYDSNSACRNCSDLILIRPAIDAAIKFILPSMQRSNSRFSLPSMQRSNSTCHRCSDPTAPAIDAVIQCCLP